MTTALVPKIHEAEIVGIDDAAPTRKIRVVACPRPFSVERVEFFADQGVTLDRLIAEAGVPEGFPVRVFIDDWPILPEWWAVTRPRPPARW